MWNATTSCSTISAADTVSSKLSPKREGAAARQRLPVAWPAIANLSLASVAACARKERLAYTARCSVTRADCSHTPLRRTGAQVSTFLSLLLMLLVQTGCTDNGAPVYELTGSAMGTSYSIKIVDTVEASERDEISAEVSDALERIENLMSTWRTESEISRFNHGTGTDWFSISAETYAVLKAAQDISRMTAGAFDVTVGPLVELWGFGPTPMRAEPPMRADIERVRQITGHQRLELRADPPAVRKRIPEVHVDLSAIAKGYAVDHLAGLLDARNVVNYLVEIGGELRARGHNARMRTWSVAVERPLANQRSLHTVLRVDNRSVATSGNYRNYFEHDGKRYSHTIDPRTGEPVTHTLASVTVVERSAMLADALATAFTVLGPDAGFDLAVENGVAALFIVHTIDGFTESRTPLFSELFAVAP